MPASAVPKPGNRPSRGAPHPLAFFGELRWIDGRPLLDTIEPYRRQILVDVLWSVGDDGAPLFNMGLFGRAKKNWKTTDLILACVYRFMAWPSDAGNDCYILASDEGQAGDDLALCKKLFAVNPTLARRVTVQAKEIVRKDGRGVLKILPARDVSGAHGKTFLFCGYDEIHSYRSHDLFEALAPDPSRPDVLVWVTSYAGLRHAPGVPLYDLMQTGKRGDDPRMYFSWYAADYTTDQALADDTDATPEQRANPSMASWGNDSYLATQRKRLPSHKYRRLHLNLPGAPDGAAFDGDKVMAAIVTGRRNLVHEPGRRYVAFVDMSGGSNDEAVLAISHHDAARKVAVLDLIVSQTGKAPFNPRHATKKFAAVLKEWGLSTVTGDAYGGETFRSDFRDLGVNYVVCLQTTSELYELLEPRLNAGEVELPDEGKLQEQLLTLVWRGSKIDHQSGDHDDWAAACAGAIWLAAERWQKIPIIAPFVHYGGSSGGLSPAQGGAPSEVLPSFEMPRSF